MATGRVIVVTGLSGAGKTTALAVLADVGYYVVDNVPPELASMAVAKLMEEGVDQVALGVYVRLGSFLDDVQAALTTLASEIGEVEVLYLDAMDEVLVRRFSETRRPHPMMAGRHRHSVPEAPTTLEEAVRLERRRLSPLRDRDTSLLNVHELRRMLIQRYGAGTGPAMLLKVMSFGFKHGVPLDADVMFDVRFLDNPHFVAGLRPLTGMDAAVSDYVLASPGALELLDKLEDLLAFAIPRYEREGKSYLTVAIGCTGGRHRSVALARELARRLGGRLNREVGLVHRDASRGAVVTSLAPQEGG